MVNALKIKISFFLRKINVFRLKMMGINIGNNVYISWGARIDTTYKNLITIQDNVHITSGVYILSHDHTVDRFRKYPEDNGRTKVIIGKNSFIGVGAIILRGVQIGENAIVAAGAVVSKDVPMNSIVSGNPAKVARTFVPIKKRSKGIT